MIKLIRNMEQLILFYFTLLTFLIGLTKIIRIYRINIYFGSLKLEIMLVIKYIRSKNSVVQLFCFGYRKRGRAKSNCFVWVIEKEVVANRKDEPEEAAVQPCCRCSGWINSEAQIFDSETCSHVVCVECRFKEEKCVICANDAPANTSILEKNSDANLFCSETDFKYFKRKTFNTDHIVDVVEGVYGS